MTDFAAAQERILARRAARDAAAAQHRTDLIKSRAVRLLRLPPTLRAAVQESLHAWDAVSSPLGTQPAFRVGQVDAELLDEELLNLLKSQAGEGLKLFGAHLKDEYGAEIGASLRAILWKLSIWDHGASYGASLQGLKYIDARARKFNKFRTSLVHALCTTSNDRLADIAFVTEQDSTAASKLQRLAYGLITVGGRYGWSRWEDHLSRLENGYDEPSTLFKRLSRLTTIFNTTHNIAAFASFLVFLYNGRYRTLTDRILRMRLVPSSNQTSREVSFEFLNRQLVWHAFTEFLLFLLPLVGIGRWKRWIARAWKKAKKTFSNLRHGQASAEDEDDASKGELAFLPERTCAICYQDQNPTSGQSEQDVISAGANSGIIGNASTDITNPYETVACGCIYCFVCLARRIEAEEGEGWVCLRCAEVVKECKPWSGDVYVREQSLERKGSRKSIAWADMVDEDEGIGMDEEEKLEQVEPRPVEDED